MGDPAGPDNFEAANSVLKGIAAYKNSPEFSDIVVTVDNSDFHCHRLILAAASDFFKAAFRSDMKESRNSKMSLQNVEKGVFSLILDFAYDGKDILSEQNIFEIWTVSDMLQMPLLLQQCKRLFDKLCNAKTPVKTIMALLGKARQFDEEVKLRLLNVVILNFPQYARDLKHFMLEEDELKFVLSGDELAFIVDAEDDIVEFVLKWAAEKCSSAPNPGKTVSHRHTEKKVSSPSHTRCSLKELLDCTRYLLLSPMFVHRTLVCNHLVKADSNIQTLINKLFMYQSQPHLSLTWCPDAAVHRDESPLVNALLMSKPNNGGILIVFDLKEMKWLKLSRGPNVLPSAQVSEVLWYRSGLYVFASDGRARVYLIPSHRYNIVEPSCEGMVLVINDSLYKIQQCYDYIDILSTSHFQEQFQTNSVCWKNIARMRESSLNIKSVTNIGKTIILFSIQENNQSYTILSFNKRENKYLKHISQLESNSPLVTFNHEDTVFALQEDGSLWKISLGSDSLNLEFSKELTLWEGVVLYKTKLMVVGDFPDQSTVFETLDISLPGIFQSVQLVQSSELSDPDSKVSLAVIPRKLFDP